MRQSQYGGAGTGTARLAAAAAAASAGHMPVCLLRAACCQQQPPLAVRCPRLAAHAVWHGVPVPLRAHRLGQCHPHIPGPGVPLRMVPSTWQRRLLLGPLRPLHDGGTTGTVRGARASQQYR